MFSHDTHAVVDHLKESAADLEAAGAITLADDEIARTQKGHHRGVPWQDPDRPVIGRRPEGVGLTIKDGRIGRDDRDVHHALASFLAFSTASSIPPTM